MDDEYGLDEDLDEELLQAVEQAELKHTQSQAVPPRTSTRHVVASTSAIQPGPQKNGLSSSSQIQSGPKSISLSSSSRFRPPKLPVYKDEVARSDASNTAGRTVSAHRAQNGHDGEKEALRRELLQLKQDLQRERSVRYQKEGEVKILRSGSEKTQKEHSRQLAEEVEKNTSLQDKIAALEKTMAEEAQRYRSEVLFARQEHESAVRHQRAASQYPSTVTRNRQTVPSTQTKRVISPKTKPPPQKKGFQNSFFETVSQALPRTSPTAIRMVTRSSPQTTPTKDEKGKGRAYDDVFGDNDLDMLNTSDISQDVEPIVIITLPLREEAVAFLFAHTQIDPNDRTPSIQLILRAEFDSTQAVFSERHKDACGSLFRCLGHSTHISDPSLVAKEDRDFICSLLLDLLAFATIFDEAARDQELVVTLSLLRDIFFRFEDLLWNTSIPLNDSHTRMVIKTFQVIQNVILNQRTRFMASVETPKGNNQKSISQGRRALTANATQQRPMKGESVHTKAEREMEPVLISALSVLHILAWSADDIRLSRFMTLVKTPDVFSTLLEPSRFSTVICDSLDLLLHLSFNSSMFRTLVACPISRRSDISKGAVKSAASSSEPLAFIEAIAGFLLYHNDLPWSNYMVQIRALVLLSTMSVEHADGVPLLSQSSSLVQRLIVRVAKDAANLYESVEPIVVRPLAPEVIKIMVSAIRLLHLLLMTNSSSKSLATHLLERPLGRDYFISGIGRVACADVPEWIEAENEVNSLDQIANVAHELLCDVLAPDEIEELFSLFRDDDDDSDMTEVDDDNADEDEAQLAAQHAADEH